MAEGVSNAASALGEQVGKLLEQALVDGVRQAVKSRGCTILPGRLKNGSDNVYQIDAVVYDPKGAPVVIVESKYIRYKKHNRDKASWLCVAHYNLRKTYPSIRKSIAVLSGRWSQPSKALLRSFGVDVMEKPFAETVEALRSFGVEFDWQEKDRAPPPKSLEVFTALNQAKRKRLAGMLVQDILEPLTDGIVATLDAKMEDIQQRISEVEVLLKTNRGEMILESYDSVSSSLQGLVRHVTDKSDLNLRLRENGHFGI